MEGGYGLETNRMDKRKKKRKRTKILIGLFALLLALSAYVVYEYWAGKRSANSEMSIETQTGSADFNGEESPKGKTNVLLLGIDQRGDEVTRSDTIMIGQYDAETNKVKLVSLLRDTYVNIPGSGYQKLNAAFALGGPELMRKTIQENFGIHLKYYAVVDFNGFVNIVDTLAPNGVEIEVEKDMYYKDGAGTIDLKQGKQKLTGKELLGYARFRNDARGDYARVERQQKVMKALKDQTLSFTGITKLPRVIGTIQPYLETNMGAPAILGYSKNLIINPPEQIETLSIPTDVYHTDQYVNGIGAVISHNEEETRNKIQEFLRGE